MKSENSKSRIDYIDTAKGLCMMFVIFVHIHFYFGCQYWGELCLKSFYLPLFFMLSGLFFKPYSGFYEFIMRKINTILIPFLFFYYTTSVLLTWILALIRGKTLDWSLLWAFIVPEHYPNLPIWFLICLFVQCILFYFIYSLFKRSLLAMTGFVFLAGLVGINCRELGFDFPMQFDSALSAIPFFFIGWTASKYGLLKKLDFNSSYLIMCAIAFLFIAYLFSGYVNYQKNQFRCIPFNVYVSGIFGSFFVICLSKLIRKIYLVRFIGRNSLVVLCTHQLLLQWYLQIIRKVGLGNWLTIFITFVLVILSYFIVVPFMKWIFPMFVGQKNLFKV